MADWSSLPADLLTEVILRLSRPSDSVRLGAVCTWWNRMEVDSRVRRFPTLLGLLIPGSDDSETTDVQNPTFAALPPQICEMHWIGSWVAGNCGRRIGYVAVQSSVQSQITPPSPKQSY
ncbi:hypothetical protein H6P81_007748 [Aristolochia fimbriata]|uniref:F-box domain-containing protein n=1 Tax=Aristolochia fimbriata TaxID=158543 RepID=A0AAV7F1R9_ARIFI|nr:hypothetical protein H6P81_007748 [Aristolochia fimbriata]